MRWLFVLIGLWGCGGSHTGRTTGGFRDSHAWLEGIGEGDVLRYDVATSAGTSRLELRVVRLVRRGVGVAAQMVPVGVPDVDVQTHWWVGDENGLYQLEAPTSLADPGFIPLDDAGHAIRPEEQTAGWGIPPDWSDVQAGELENGWSVDDLDMAVDRPRRDDRCARISRERTRILVCAKLGMVELVRGDEGAAPQESWRLVEIHRGE